MKKGLINRFEKESKPLLFFNGGTCVVDDSNEILQYKNLQVFQNEVKFLLNKDSIKLKLDSWVQITTHAPFNFIISRNHSFTFQFKLISVFNGSGDSLISSEDINNSEKKRVIVNFPQNYKMGKYVSNVFDSLNKSIVILHYNNIRITIQDLKTLLPRCLLNDNIIDFYLQYITQKYMESGAKDVHVFNTQFLPVLKKDDLRCAQRIPSKNVKIFEKDYLFFPINEKKHWMLLVVCFPRKVPLNDLKNGKKSCMLFVDSLRSYSLSGKYYQMIRRYLMLRYICENDGGDITLNDKTLPGLDCEVDKQKNGYDCGVYLLSFTDYLLREKPKQFPLRQNLFQDEQINMNRKFIWKLINEQIKL